MAELLLFPSAQDRCSSPPLPEAEDTLALPDELARQRALDIRSSWIVEAPAGSGKTGLLIQRLLKLLAFADVQRPGEVLAITFTRKAANELRNRVLEQLTAAADHPTLAPDAGDFERETRQLARAVLARDAQRGWQLLHNPQTLNIRTIDSFCGELARSLPLLSGGAGHWQPVDDGQPLYEEAATRALYELGGQDPTLTAAIRTVLLHRDANLGDCVQLLSGMLGAREQWAELVPLERDTLSEEILDATVRPRLEATLRRVIREALAHARELFGTEPLEQLARFAARLAESASLVEGSSFAACRHRPDPPGPDPEDVHHWIALVDLLLRKDGGWRSAFNRKQLDVELEKADVLWLKDFVADLQSREALAPGLLQALCALRCLPPARYPEEQWRVTKALFHVLRRALAELKVLFAERRTCDFAELALTARTLLRPGGYEGDLPQVPGAQLAHLLVDEMQDTSASQYELLELLTRTWDGSTQTLFLVGDPKQSIYAFRQARVERFLRTQHSQRLGDIPLGPLRLTRNFRSQASLVHSFNTTFEAILPRPGAVGESDAGPIQVPFVAATPTRAPGAYPALHWHLQQKPAAPTDEADDPAPPTAAEDARLLRRTIEAFLNRWQTRPCSLEEQRVYSGPRPARVAVLARGRSHLAPVIAEFQTERDGKTLPFRAVDIQLLNEQPEVLDLIALTRALLHPGDRTSWLAVLRSPVCGLRLADLLSLTGEGPDADREATVAHLVVTRAHLLSTEGQQLLARAWPRLAEAVASLGRTSFSTLVERTWRTLGADAVLTPGQARNAERLLDLLRKIEAEGERITVAALQRRLATLYAEPSAAAASVELMTIHKAKGLEWDLVVVPALERGTGSTRHELLRWLELDTEQGSEAVLAPIQGKGDQASALSGWLGTLQRERELAEAKRLFYVACTRAREELHLFGRYSLRKTGDLTQPRPDSLLRAAWAVAAPLIDAQRAQAPAVTAASPPCTLVAFPAAVPEPGYGLALAAAADPDASTASAAPAHVVRRLPPGFDPLQRFRAANGPGLPYPPASLLRHEAALRRPEGSFAARAFGNVVHRFLQLLAQERSRGQQLQQLRLGLAGWRPRVLTAFRAEGLDPALCARDTDRALAALSATLDDAVGAWLLAPHTAARSEHPVQLGADAAAGTPSRSLRADRTFLGGSDPLIPGDTHLWIVDFKTGEPGGRSEEAFFAAERARYEPQLEAYARASAGLSSPIRPIVLALFYPLLTKLLYWPFPLRNASQREDSFVPSEPPTEC